MTDRANTLSNCIEYLVVTGPSDEKEARIFRAAFEALLPFCANNPAAIAAAAKAVGEEVTRDDEPEEYGEHYQDQIDDLEKIQQSESGLNQYTVIATDTETRQIFSHLVESASANEAYSLVAKVSGLEMVAAIDGHLHEGQGVTYPGTATVLSETILEQPDIFDGSNIADFYVDEDLTPDEYWLIKSADDRMASYEPEAISKAEQCYFSVGGRKVS